MVPLAVIVGDELGDRAAKMSLAQWNHEIKTFLFERTSRVAEGNRTPPPSQNRT